MLHGWTETRTVRVEPGPFGPEKHVHIERRDLSVEEARRLAERTKAVLRDPDKFRRDFADAVAGRANGVLDDMFPELKEFLEKVRAGMGRGL